MELHFEKQLCLGSGIPFFFLFFLVTLPNGFILMVLYKNPLRCFRRSFSVFLAFLCAIDFFVGLVVCSGEALTRFLCFFGYQSIPREGDIVTILDYFGINSSILLVTSMSVDRFIAVLFPHTYRRKLKPKTTIIINTCIVTFSLIFALLQLSSISVKVYRTIDLHLHTTFSLSTTAVAYLGIFFSVKKQSRIFSEKQKAMPSNTTLNDIRRERKAKMERKLAVTSFFILLVLILSLIPYFAVILVDIYCESCGKKNWFLALKESCIVFLFVNSVANPFLATFRISELKKTCRIVCGFSLRKNNEATANFINLTDFSSRPMPGGRVEQSGGLLMLNVKCEAVTLKNIRRLSNLPG
ncbi:melanocortin receptor 4-like [Montipora foliosa]|uniref:melanocortin receptor 4-like n=1 Tax=Montipora foliosa TaxID=591990 RepID=UPI0035F1443A